ncbi:MAG: GH3 auxin-responsive promoter family protein [Bacteroidetes bacterium]|nr:GH3 auxin-responsive promoter family protein [Bacteroidota bacterium]
MPFNSVFSWLIGKRMARLNDCRDNPFALQYSVFNFLISEGKSTEFGLRNQFNSIISYSDFSKHVPLQDYGTLKDLIDRSIEGEESLLWPGKTNWFAKSSGTTADRVKILPVTSNSLFNNHYVGGKDLLAQYYANLPNRELFNAKHLIVGGSGETRTKENGVFVGDLSAIIVNNLPWWTEWRRAPKKEIALQSDWEKKLNDMAKATIYENICILAGVPSWTLLLLKRVLEISGKKTISEVWPNLELYIHGGMNFGPYQQQFDALIGNSKMNYVESYNSSEGYFGLQDQLNSKDLLLLTNSEVFYEFIPINEFDGINSKTVVPLEEVKTDVDYALVISTSAGLWRYIIGDTIRFSSIKPFRFRVTGRTSHSINGFGEKMIVDHTEKAISEACSKTNAAIMEYTVAPYFNLQNSNGGHEWVIEFSKEPADYEGFKIALDEALKKFNSDYDVKRFQNMNIDFPKFHFVEQGTFHRWLKSKNKLGGQHKVPRLMNNREILEQILLKND